MRLTVPLSLRWGDQDAFGHVNNVSLMTLLEEARVRAFWGPTAAGESAPPTGVLDGGADSAVLTLVAGHRIEYRQPLQYRREPLDVQLWVSRLGGASMTVGYEVLDGPETAAALGGEPRRFAVAESTIVLVGRDSGRPVRIDEETRAALEPYVDEPADFSRR